MASINNDDPQARINLLVPPRQRDCSWSIPESSSEPRRARGKPQYLRPSTGRPLDHLRISLRTRRRSAVPDSVVVPSSFRKRIFSISMRPIHRPIKEPQPWSSSPDISFTVSGMSIDISDTRERCADCNRNAPSQAATPPLPLYYHATIYPFWSNLCLLRIVRLRRLSLPRCRRPALRMGWGLKLNGRYWPWRLFRPTILDKIVWQCSFNHVLSCFVLLFFFVQVGF